MTHSKVQVTVLGVRGVLINRVQEKAFKKAPPHPPHPPHEKTEEEAKALAFAQAKVSGNTRCACSKKG